MKSTTLVATLLASTTLAALAIAQTAAPNNEQLRQTVSRLRGNRIETPNSWDELTPAQKKYVESILSGPRADISGPLGVMLATPELAILRKRRSRTRGLPVVKDFRAFHRN